MRHLVVIALVLGACSDRKAAPPAPAPAPAASPAPAPSATVLKEETSGANQVRFFSAVAADLDGDGKPELVAGGFADEQASRRSTVPVYAERDGAWTQIAEAGWDDGRGSLVRNIEVGDLDGDGHAEIVALGRVGPDPHTTRARLAVLALRNGKLETLAETTWGKGAYTHGYGLDLGDVDGDGRLDIVTGGFDFDGTHETGFVRTWTFAKNTLTFGKEVAISPDAFPSMRVNGLAVGDVDGDHKLDVVVAGRLGALKSDALRKDHSLRTENGLLVVLRGDLTLRDRFAWSKGTTTRLRTVAIADLDHDGVSEILAAGQWDANGKAALGMFQLRDGKIALVQDASTDADGSPGEVKNIFVDGDRVLISAPAGARPAREGNVEAWRLVDHKLVRDAALHSQAGSDTLARAAVVMPTATGSAVITVGHSLKNQAIVGQLLRWELH